MGQAFEHICTMFDDPPDQILTLLMEIAIRRSNIPPCNTEETQSINRLVIDRTSDIIQLTHCTVQYQQPHHRGIEEMLIFDQNCRLIVRPINTGPALIIYSRGYYIGLIQNGRAHDSHASMVVLEQPVRERGEAANVMLTIEGVWQHGDLMRGRALDGANRQVFSLDWDTLYRNINLTFNQGQIQTYRGQISLIASDHLAGILSGKASITFRDGSTYEGTVMNGRMHSLPNENGLFISADGREIYNGPYVEGQRHGMAWIKRRHEGVDYIFDMIWNHGIPDVNTIRMRSRQPIRGILIN